MSWFSAKLRGGLPPNAAPLARSDELIVERADDELLVYDERTDYVHCLGVPAAKVWQACDGETTTKRLGDALELDDDTVSRALEELRECRLLDDARPAGVTRREAGARFAKLGATAAMAPLIYSIAAPIPEAAATVSQQARCITGNQGTALQQCQRLGFSGECCFGGPPGGGCPTANRFYCVDACNGAGTGGCPIDQLPSQGQCSSSSSIGGCVSTGAGHAHE